MITFPYHFMIILKEPKNIEHATYQMISTAHSQQYEKTHYVIPDYPLLSHSIYGV